MPVVVIGRTEVAARLLRYTEKEKAGQVEPRVLHAEGVRCRVPTAMEEFAALRELHGKQGATRRVKARYELPDRDAGEEAVYIRKRRPSGRKYWAVAKDGEVATHVRREAGQVVRENEAVHLITSFGIDEVNPDAPQQVRAAFEYTVAMMRDLYPGAQMKLVGQADGAGMADADGNFLTSGGKFHVHAVLNAVVAERMEVDGQVWEAGRKLSGALTDINRVRQRADEFNSAHHAEYSLPKQRLASVEDQRREKRSVRDRRMAAEGKRSNHDVIRDAYEQAMDDPRSLDLDGFVEVLGERGVEVTVRGSKRPALSYRLPDAMKTNVRGTTLGEHYAYEETLEQLAANAAGEPRRRRPQPAPEPVARPATAISRAEVEQAQELMQRLARDERARALDDRVEARLAQLSEKLGYPVEELRAEYKERLLEEESAAAVGEKTMPSASAAGLGDGVRSAAAIDDLSMESMPSVAVPDKPAVPAPASAPLPQDARKADPFADMWAEWEATREQRAAQIMADLGLGKSLEQIDAEKAEEAAQAAPEPRTVTETREQAPEPVEREESTSSASAADVPAPASAPLPPPADGPYRSRLWEFESDTPSVRDRAHRLAAYEEIAVPMLEAGERLDDSVLTSIGVRESVMKKLGPFMHPAFREQLEMRAKKLALAQQLHESNMQPAAKRLRAQVAAGVYETVAVESARKKVRLRVPQERQIEDDGLSL
ncbi:relaxase/mobilization nuclease domain-containing protein [Glutamicibacter creatinolyticus]|uniref:relaxase/mobilization nuclease domain-containing protein n=1 Tax=Glutamicibacter creatinolyticus TaxID=162496 RepID=UPI00340D9122